MKLKLAVSLICSATLLFSCQKEIDYAGTGNGNPGGGSSGNSNGDLFVKALQVTVATNDTNVITFSYDANKRLLKYSAVGKVNGIEFDTHYDITRLADGKIKKITGSVLQQGFGASTSTYTPVYVTGTSKLAYVLNEHTTIIGNITDSAVYSYNAANQVTEKETFSEALGFPLPGQKETYTYDASGNLTSHRVYNSTGSGSPYTLSLTVAYTYSTHKSYRTLGEESYIILSAENVSKNEVVKTVNDYGSNGQYVFSFTQQQYNSFDRPASGLLSFTPKPPGYDMKLTYFYQ